MKHGHLTPLGALARGLMAGAVGTLAMDIAAFARYKRSGGTEPFPVYELGSRLSKWEDAPAPAQVGKRITEGFLQRELPAENAALMNNIMHWGYGLTWGALFGILAGSLRRTRLAYGVPFAAGVWANSYAVLPLAKLYKPIWQYPVPVLAKDFGGHVVYGVTTAACFRLLRGHA